jgi:hypothetical protein
VCFFWYSLHCLFNATNARPNHILALYYAEQFKYASQLLNNHCARADPVYSHFRLFL